MCVYMHVPIVCVCVCVCVTVFTTSLGVAIESWPE